MSYQERHCVPSSQPYLSGHFPDDPVVPAVIILEMVRETISRWKGEVDMTGVPSAKFKAPLRPDVAFTICLHEVGDCVVAFECKTEDLMIAEGRAEVSRPSALGGS